MRHLHGHTGPVRCLAYSPDGRTIASGSDDKTVVVWDYLKGQWTTRLHTGDSVRTLLFTPDGKHLVAASWDDGVLWWRQGKRQPERLELGSREVVWALAIAADGTSLAAGTLGGGVFLLSPTGRGSHSPRGAPAHSWPVTALAFSPLSGMLATGSHDRTIKLWEGALREQATLLGHTDWVRCLAFSPDGRTLASGGDDAVIRLWDVAGRQQRAVLRGHTHWVRQVAFTPDGKSLLSASWDETVRVWDVAAGQEREAFNWKIGRVHALALSPDGMTAAAGGDHHVLVVWDCE